MKYELEKLFKLVNYKCSEEQLMETLEFFSVERAEVRKQFNNLSWNADEEVRENAVRFLADNLLPCEYIYLVFADIFDLSPCDSSKKYYTFKQGKSLWENAAKTIVRIGWPKVNNILVPLFMWLIDPNWPGSNLISDFLMSLPEDVLKSKAKEILDSPQDYEKYIFDELKEAIEEMCGLI